MTLPQLNLDALRNVPATQKVALLFLLVGGIIAGFYFYIAEPKSEIIAVLEAENSKLDGEIQTLTIKVKHLDELVAANKQLEIELAKRRNAFRRKKKPSCCSSRYLTLVCGWGSISSYGSRGRRQKMRRSSLSKCRSMLK